MHSATARYHLTGQYFDHFHRLRSTFHRQLGRPSPYELRPEPCRNRFRNEDGGRELLGQRLDTGGEVDWLTHDAVLHPGVRPYQPCDDLADVNSNTDLHRRDPFI